MSEKPSYIAYVDLLGIGNASVEDSQDYHDQLRRFRLALCTAVDQHLHESDKVFAFSDCAFASSRSLQRVGKYLVQLQYELWQHNIFLKGAITIGKPEHYEFADVSGQTEKLIGERRKKLQGYWFSKQFVKPALLEKNLKGIAIQVDTAIQDSDWIDNNVVASSYFSSETSKKPTVIRDLLIPSANLPSLESLLKIYMLVSNNSRRVSRYYIPLIVTWIKSHDYSRVSCDPKTGAWTEVPLPLAQLVKNPRIASEVAALVGGPVIFYALLEKVAAECEETNVTDHVFDFIASSKKLRDAAELIPNEICSAEVRQRVAESRIRYLFKTPK
jgi:hypothetical protein